jgi:aspartyl-tRNA(Asn)/glutamyl-tRNA(Gln) amidotransferase subunit A
MQDAVEGFLATIECYDGPLSSFITVTSELARGDALRIDATRAEGKKLPLDGFVVAVKDNIDVEGVPTTAGSHFFRDYVALADAEVARRLRSGGAIIVGKANLHELAFGGTTDNPFYGTCRNPWDPDYSPGGSSGGSAVALAIDACVASLGTDTGGSIRIPSGYCGVSGLRPTFGSVSTRGTIPLSRSFDAVGPMARNVRDIATMFEVMASHDRDNPGSVEPPRARAAADTDDLRGLRIGVARPFFFDDLDPEVGEAIERAVEVLRDLGATVFDTQVPGAAEAGEIKNPIVFAEAYELYRERLAERPDCITDDTRAKIERGKDVTGADIARARERMARYQRRLERSFAHVDVVLTPVTRSPAPPAAAPETSIADLVRCTYPWALGHVPALAIPCGFSKRGLPIGLQLAARRWNERALFRTGIAYQRVTDWHRRRPPHGHA